MSIHGACYLQASGFWSKLQRPPGPWGCNWKWHMDAHGQLQTNNRKRTVWSKFGKNTKLRECKPWSRFFSDVLAISYHHIGWTRIANYTLHHLTISIAIASATEWRWNMTNYDEKIKNTKVDHVTADRRSIYHCLSPTRPQHPHYSALFGIYSHCM